jgi:hypothetical protein
MSKDKYVKKEELKYTFVFGALFIISLLCSIYAVPEQYKQGHFDNIPGFIGTTIIFFSTCIFGLILFICFLLNLGLIDDDNDVNNTPTKKKKIP